MSSQRKFHSVLVTGGAGFIGSQFTRDLLNQGYRVTVLDDFSTGSRRNIEECLQSPLFQLIKGSILDPSAVDRALGGCDAVVHFAVSNLRVSIQNPKLSHEVNASGTLTVLERCRNHNVSRFVYISSSEVYGSAIDVPMTEEHPTHPSTVYASSKLAGEYYTLSYGKMYGLEVSVLRPFNNFGPRSHFEKENGEIIPRSFIRVLNGLSPFVFGEGKQTRDFIYVADTSRLVQFCLESSNTHGRILNLAYGKEISMVDLVQKICDLVNPSLSPRHLNVRRPGDVQRHYASTGKISKIPGYLPPSTDIDSGLKFYCDWLIEQKFDLPMLLGEVGETNW